MFLPELVILTINAIIVLAAYLVIYPKYCGSNLNKICFNDLISSGLALFLSGTLYWGTGIEFNIIVGSVNWFWFTLLSYFALELPFCIHYFKKYGVMEEFENT